MYEGRIKAKKKNNCINEQRKGRESISADVVL